MFMMMMMKKRQHFKNELAEEQAELKQFDDDILEQLHDNADDETIDKEMGEASECRKEVTCAILSNQGALA